MNATALLQADAAPERRWSRLSFLVPVMLIPFVTFLGVLSWQSDQAGAFRAIQLCFGWLVVVQFAAVLRYAFDRGWFELFAYVFHMVATGAASLTVTFRLEQYPQDLLYDQMALLGLGGQLMLGVLMLNSRPLRTRAVLDPRVLAICAMVVCTAALIKFGIYLRFIGLQGGDHLAIYTEGDALRDYSPAPIRILAAGAPLVALLAITQPGLPRWCRLLGALAILLEFAIGIRSRPLFILLSALALLQHRVKLTLTRKLLIAGASVVGLLAITAIGYYREQNTATAEAYFWIVLQSLFGIFEAGVFGAQIPDSVPIVVGQVVPLLAPTPLNSIDTVAKLLSSTFTPGMYNTGYGYSSAALTETVMLLGPVASGFAYPLLVLGIISAIKGAVRARANWMFLYGACVLPIAFYIWRAELWQMVIPAVKAAPFILALLGADAYARLSQRRAPLREGQGRESFAP